MKRYRHLETEREQLKTRTQRSKTLPRQGLGSPGDPKRRTQKVLGKKINSEISARMLDQYSMRINKVRLEDG